MIGSHRYGFNAIFMLNEVGKDYFPEVSIESIHSDAYTKLRTETAWNEVRDLPWVENLIIIQGVVAHHNPFYNQDFGAAIISRLSFFGVLFPNLKVR